MGWQERVAAYKTLRKRAELMRKIRDKDHVGNEQPLFRYLGEEGTTGSIALTPNHLSEVDYIDQLIVSEQQQAKMGWQERVAAYKTLRKRAELMRKIRDKDPCWE